MRLHVPVCSAVEMVLLVVSAERSMPWSPSSMHALYCCRGFMARAIVFAVFSCLTVSAPSLSPAS